MFRRTTLAVLACVGVFTAQSVAANGFSIDMSRDTLRKMGGATFFTDLAIGESAYMGFYSMCKNGRDLYLMSNRAIGKKLNFSYNYKFVRRAGNLVIATVEKGEKVKDRTRARIPSQYANLRSCDKAQAYYSYDLKPVRVISINGKTNLSDLLKSLK